MEDIFAVDFTINELNFLRNALDPISIQGRDARFVASLQIKLENELKSIQNMIEENKAKEEAKKQAQLQEIIEASKKPKLKAS